MILTFLNWLMEDTSSIYIYFYYVNFIIVNLNFICSYIIITN